jgi:uncharacterized protein GlcG (DUF336 family)
MGLHVDPEGRLTHAGAFAMLKGAIAMAAEMQAPCSIAVVDAGGHLLAFLRLDGAPAASQHGAIRNAVAGALDAGSAAPAGGLPAVVAGRVAGGVGVDSGKAADDATLARAGLACLQAP